MGLGRVPVTPQTTPLEDGKSLPQQGVKLLVTSGQAFMQLKQGLILTLATIQITQVEDHLVFHK